MANKFRRDKIKREHGIIDGLLPVLEELADLPEISAIIPGRIRVTRARVPGLEIRLQVETTSGIKLGARWAKLAQEVFVICSNRETVRQAVLTRPEHQEA